MPAFLVCLSLGVAEVGCNATSKVVVDRLQCCHCSMHTQAKLLLFGKVLITEGCQLLKYNRSLSTLHYLSLNNPLHSALNARCIQC